MENKGRFGIAVAAGFLLASATPAQLAAGSRAPEFEIKNAFNGAPLAFGDLAGKAVLIEFFATW
jgi:hypothetical protein